MIAPRFLPTGVLVVLVGFGCAGLPEKQPIQSQPIAIEAGEWRVTDQVVVITDGSGTQYVNRTFPDAKALTRSFVASMPEASAPAASSRGYEAALIGFGGDDRMTAPLGPFDRGQLASKAGDLQVMGDINGMGGETPLHEVLHESALALQGRSGRAALVVFSDGLPDDAGLALFSARQLVEARNQNVCIHTVQTGTDPQGTSFLKQLASLTSCGSYRNGDQLSSNYEVQQLARTVFVGPADLPAVAAAGPCDSVVRLRGIEFAFDKADVTPESRPVLDIAVEQLKGCSEIRVTISGYTDAIGTESYNQGLSFRRAESVKDFLVQSGVSASRLEAEGRGEADPVASNDTADGRRRNRRVELVPLR